MARLRVRAGMLKMYRVINEECLRRAATHPDPAELERTVRKLQTQVDKNCN